MTHQAYETRTPNRLIREKSPYLLQHAYNPVQWYPWGDEAFTAARQEQKPIFLSIGYSTCHWCHVMERESFEDPQVAALLNRWFISVKVDREEHPDVDHLYMQAVVAMTGQGGWPLTVFLTPDLKPFFGGTYFPPERRWNVPGMNELLPAIASAWEAKRDEVLQSAEQLTTLVRREGAQAMPPGSLVPGIFEDAVRQAEAAFDESFGGFGDAPKFPRPHELSFLLHAWARRGNARALEMATATLDHLSRGGIHDQLGGGFHRYATDRQWLVPHFEKMLYDQALLARAYLEAYRITHREEYAAVARGIVTYVLRDLTDPSGGFYAAEDADSEGEEGRFYVWTPEEVIRLVGREDGERFNRCYGVTAEGNWEHGRSILHIAQPLEPAAAEVEAVKAALLAARQRRVRPHRDDKVLTSWNGLMIASLAYGAATLQDPAYLAAAQRAAAFIRARLWQDGRLLRRHRDGESRYPGTLEDYAFFTYGLLELYQAGHEPRDLAQAKELAQDMVRLFWDEASGRFALRSREEPPLLAPVRGLYDGATPSGNSIAALVVLRLGHLTMEETWTRLGRRLLEAATPEVARTPFGYPQLLIAGDYALGPLREVVIAGDTADPRMAHLLTEVHRRFLPRTAVVIHPSTGPGRPAIEALTPYVQAHEPLGGAPAAYVCENYTCQLPTTEPTTLGRLLDGGQ